MRSLEKLTKAKSSPSEPTFYAEHSCALSGHLSLLIISEINRTKCLHILTGTRVPIPLQKPIFCWRADFTMTFLSLNSSTEPRRTNLQQLAELIRGVEYRGGASANRQPLRTGWTDIDDTLHRLQGQPGLRRGAIHEWFATPPSESCPCRNERASQASGWVPPIAALTQLSWRALAAEQADRRTQAAVIWIGRSCHPSVWSVTREAADIADRDNRMLMQRSILVDPRGVKSRLWAIDLSLRCPAVAMVIADGRGLSMAATRRLQLAAEAGSSIALLARPQSDRKSLSAAATRWTVGTSPSANNRPCYSITLWRCKGVVAAESSQAEPLHARSANPQSITDANIAAGIATSPSSRAENSLTLPCQWILEESRDQGLVVVPLAVGGHADASTVVSKQRA